MVRWELAIPEDPQQRTIERLERGEDGKFSDDDLARILTESIEDVGGAFGANNVPAVLKMVEVLGIHQARAWHPAPLNEFRMFFGLEPYKTFEAFNPDPAIADLFKSFYGHPDFIELYPGIVCEETKKPMCPGVGIAPGYTLSRAILSDAITMVRGDRHFTLNWHTGSLTNWGLKEVESNPLVEEGCVFYKLILTAFPCHFEPDSVYAHYPMVIPSENEKILKELGKAGVYSFQSPEARTATVSIKSIYGVKAVLGKHDVFSTKPYKAGLDFLGGQSAHKACLAGDGTPFQQSRGELQRGLHPDQWSLVVKFSYELITKYLLHKWSSKVGTSSSSEVDIIKNVGNLAGVHFAAQIFSIPLRTEKRPDGIFSEHQLNDTLPLQIAARPICEALGKIMEAEVVASKTHSLGEMLGKVIGQEPSTKSFGSHILRKLSEYGNSPAEVVFSYVLLTSAPLVADNASAFAQIIDFYLGPGKEHWPKIRELARHDGPESDDALTHYSMEGIRLNGSHAVLRHVREETTVIEDGDLVKAQQGDRIHVDLTSVAMDPEVYPEPETVRLDRPLDSYMFYGHGRHRCLGEGISRVSLTAMLRVVARLENLRRAPGPQGELKTVVDPRGFKMYMDSLQSRYSPYPTTMKVMFDGEV